MEFTGERVVPGGMSDTRDLQAHLARYVWAMHPYCSGKVVIDAACGTGYGTKILSYAAKETHGIDNNQGAVDYCRLVYPDRNITFHLGDVTALPFNSNFANIVVSFETIEHLQKPELFVREAHRVLASAGLFIVSAPENSGSVWHVRDYGSQDLYELLTKSASWKVLDYFRQGYKEETMIRHGAEKVSEHDTHIYICEKA